ncbi:hypothetical protein [Polymorphospora rubra]|uniref:hypothetical protein n=1 Tax=Polymorphospora rubra TaxID=338584 RepID=UPI001BB4014C|nr:hypothetical protein [Polymorphospora rubra]
MARSVVDAAQWASTDDDVRTVVAAACQQRRTTPGEILTVLGRMPRVRGTGGTARRRLAAAADPAGPNRHDAWRFQVWRSATPA